MTLRDRIWDEALTLLATEGKFKISDLDFENEGQKHTIRRTLRSLEEDGWLERTSQQSPIWRIGWKAEMILDIDEETVEESKE